jgi:ribosomal protein S18 acetylase RimI-like enzyme
VEVTEAHRGSRGIEEAAQIWAEATAARDGDEDVADLSLSRPVIEAVLDGSPAAFVLVARTEDGTAVGFVAVAPATVLASSVAPSSVAPSSVARGSVAAGAGTSQPRAEVRYLGVRPDMWGRGVGEWLLTDLRSRLAAAGFAGGQLLVYADNSRATALYERLGWQVRGEPTPHPRTGKPEQRYELDL